MRFGLFVFIYVVLLAIFLGIGGSYQGWGMMILIILAPFYGLFALIILAICVIASSRTAGTILAAVIAAPVTIGLLIFIVSLYNTIGGDRALDHAKAAIDKLSVPEFPVLPVGYDTIALDRNLYAGSQDEIGCTANCRLIIANTNYSVEQLSTKPADSRLYTRSTDPEFCQRSEHIESYLDFIGDGHVGTCVASHPVEPTTDAIVLSSISTSMLSELSLEEKKALPLVLIKIDERHGTIQKQLALVRRPLLERTSAADVLSQAVGFKPKPLSDFSGKQAARLIAIIAPYLAMPKTAETARRTYSVIMAHLMPAHPADRDELLGKALTSSDPAMRIAGLEVTRRENAILQGITDPAILSAVFSPDPEEMRAGVKALYRLSPYYQPAKDAFAELMLHNPGRFFTFDTNAQRAVMETLFRLEGPYDARYQRDAMAVLADPEAVKQLQLDAISRKAGLAFTARTGAIAHIAMSGEVEPDGPFKRLVFDPRTPSRNGLFDLYCSFSRGGRGGVTEGDKDAVTALLIQIPADWMWHFALVTTDCFPSMDPQKRRSFAAPIIHAVISERRADGGLSQDDEIKLNDVDKAFGK